MDVIFQSKHVIDMRSPVLAMCRVGAHVVLALKHGTLVAVNASSFQNDYQISQPELERDNLVEILTLNDHPEQIAMAYKDGSIVLVSCLTFTESGVRGQESNDNTLSIVKAKCMNVKLSIIRVASSRLYTIEVSKTENSKQVELWCGCDNSFIEVFNLHEGSSQLQLKTKLDTRMSSADIPQDADIVQLKSSFSTTAGHMMYALHGCGSVISCWSVHEQPVLNNAIKLTQLSSPGTQIASPITPLETQGSKLS